MNNIYKLGMTNKIIEIYFVVFHVKFNHMFDVIVIIINNNNTQGKYLSYLNSDHKNTHLICVFIRSSTNILSSSTLPVD